MKYAISILSILVIFLFHPETLSARFTFQPIFSSGIEYTDNVFGTEDNEKEEYITTISAGFTASYLEKSGGIDISYRPEYSIYGRYDENNTFRQNADLHAWKDLSKTTRVDFDNSFRLTEDPLSEEDVIRDDEIIVPGDDSIRTGREVYYTNTSRANIVHRIGEDDRIFAGFLYSFLKNDDPEVQDNERYEGNVGMAYWFDIHYGLDADVVYTRGIFDQDSDLVVDPTGDFDNWSGSLKLTRRSSRHFSQYISYNHTYRDYDENAEEDYMVYAPSIGFDWQIEKTLRLTMGVGYFYQDVDEDENGQEEDEQGMFFDAAVNKSFDFKRGSVQVDGAAGLRQDDFGAQSAGLEQFVSTNVTANYLFAKNLNGSVSGDLRYSDTVGVDEEDGINEQIRYAFGAGMSYFPYRWMTMNLDYRYTHQYNRSDIESEDEEISENRVSFTVTVVPVLR